MSKPIPPPGSRSGYTLLELSAVLLLLGISFSALLPAAQHQMDRMAVMGATAEVAGLFHRVRFEAVAHGGAILRLETTPASVALMVGGAVVERSELEGVYRVALKLSRDRSETDLHFDPLGLGRVASQTLSFTRGRAEVDLVVSSYGRIIRR
jgi:prepilin-type N-terminal cleavage/methylation domain-containing protein